MQKHARGTSNYVAMTGGSPTVLGQVRKEHNISFSFFWPFHDKRNKEKWAKVGSDY